MHFWIFSLGYDSVHASRCISNGCLCQCNECTFSLSSWCKPCSYGNSFFLKARVLHLLCSWFHENSYWMQGQDVYKSAQVRDKQIFRILGQVLLCLLIWCPNQCIYNIIYVMYRHLQLQQLLFWGRKGSLMFFLWATFLIQRTYSICWTQCKPLYLPIFDWL